MAKRFFLLSTSKVGAKSRGGIARRVLPLHIFEPLGMADAFFNIPAKKPSLDKGISKLSPAAW